LLVDYDFYDWDSENQQNYEIVFGLPREKLFVLGYSGLYDSWGYDAVNNDSADPMFNPDEWLYLDEDIF